MRRHGMILCALIACLLCAAAAQTFANGGDYLLLTTGWNDYGQLGLGDATQRSLFTRLPDMRNMTAVSGGYGFSLARDADGYIWVTGRNAQGQLGTGDNTDTRSFVSESDMASVISAGNAHSLIWRSSDGVVLATGQNDYGQLGLGDTTYRNSFTEVTIAATIIAVSAGGAHSLALDEDGNVWATGRNTEGQLGLGDNDSRTSFTKVSGPAGITAISAGFNHSLLLDSDGSVWVSGKNSEGQLGLHDTNNRNTFVEVPAYDLASVVEISAGGYHSLARLSDGTIQATGSNAQGACGFTEYGHWADWCQPLNATNVTGISAGYAHSLIRKGDGTGWATGSNGQGELGLGDLQNRFGFTQIPGLAGVAALQAGDYHSLALAAKHIQVTAPSAAGITAERGTAYTVRWTSDGLPANAKVNITLRDDQGTRWLLASNVPNKGAWLWQIGKWKSSTQDVYPDNGSMYIEIGTPDGFNWDESDQSFAIGTVESLFVAGQNDVNEGATTYYACTANYNAGPSQDVTTLVKWRALSRNPKDPTRYQSCKYAVMQPGGQLSTKAVSNDQQIRVTAAYGKGKAAISNGRDVTIHDLP